MDIRSRLANAEEQSHELHRSFSHLDHKIREFIELQHSLGDLHAALDGLQVEIQSVRQELSSVHQLLPSVARKEELARISKKLDSIPFEQFAQRKREAASTSTAENEHESE
jgi:hypothetical protein